MLSSWELISWISSLDISKKCYLLKQIAGVSFAGVKIYIEQYQTFAIASIITITITDKTIESLISKKGYLVGAFGSCLQWVGITLVQYSVSNWYVHSKSHKVNIHSVTITGG